MRMDEVQPDQKKQDEDARDKAVLLTEKENRRT